MVDDVVREMGYLTLGSRLRRIGERFQSEVQRVLDDLDLPVQASQFPALAAIDRLGPLTVGDLAEAIGITQPGATRIMTHLSEIGLLDVRQSPEDQRRRFLSLTDKGRQLVETSKRDLWPRIDAAVAEICSDLTGPLLEQLTAIEHDLETTPLHHRIARQLHDPA
ncbi:MarR family winged helix-turn-helix transcriptional regulator [Mesorhizobium sp. UC22_110]|jgi:DNA-binding MarR family transcriptional regulator|uniref:MarR family winged helix-turn-helix transcriptional regulator n=1 Tax=unclassified Mesorhizobium TaxID=325217 RepID=UPI00366FC803